ncbi:HESP026 [Hemileuca sp. nucleopolyhedrovirus]|uniref:HESP026 n=1 Tax=Hemileuca sp. nucleopolyhedrovirus TaxID=1367203 RepID=S5MQ30_9ABAC|nr:HESP026 [Hemileuca sp. nucleopolyhedrovirus]AGR56778.1 HESP026 [Hemileuca sp. nucleopolyhedrovirus]
MFTFYYEDKPISVYNFENNKKIFEINKDNDYCEPDYCENFYMDTKELSEFLSPMKACVRKQANQNRYDIMDDTTRLLMMEKIKKSYTQRRYITLDEGLVYLQCFTVDGDALIDFILKDVYRVLNDYIKQQKQYNV